MKRLVHVNKKIFFPNPYVVRVSYGSNPGNAPSEHIKITRSTYRLIKGTWGAGNLTEEVIQGEIDKISPQPNNNGWLIASIFNSNWRTEWCAYFCFKDEIDALQFRLGIPEGAKHVKMWPKQLFTIHEVIDDAS